MTPQDFCYWLQGCLEGTGVRELNAAQLEQVKRHLATVPQSLDSVPFHDPEPMPEEVIRALVKFAVHSRRCPRFERVLSTEPIRCTCGLQKLFDKIDELVPDC